MFLSYIHFQIFENAIEICSGFNYPFLVPLRVKIKPDVLTTYEGRDETLTCNVSGNPKPIITWEKLNSDLPSSSSVDGNGQLKLRDLSRDNSGIYRCTGRNSMGSEAATVVLAVRKST